MAINSESPEPAGDEQDPRRLLVQRIVASSTFAGSERLTSFLQCIWDLAQQGQYDRINEQTIGMLVFGRRPDYDPGIDSIVRSHASRLRQRLERYFAEEGAGEEWLLSIPKGAYIPVFQLRNGVPEPTVDGTAQAAPEPMQPEAGLSEASRESESTGTPAFALPRSLVERRGRLLAGALVASLILLAGAGVWIARHPRPEAESAVSRQLFWSRLFNADQPTLVVNGDSGLVMLQGITKRRVTLPMYIDGTYLSTVVRGSPSAALALDLVKRRYTSYVDLTIAHRIHSIGGIDLQHTRFVYARDLRPRDFKQGNCILLGTYESTPWVQLFEPAMNFYFENDLAGGVFSIVNRQPKPGEQARYDARFDDPEHTVYGVAAFRPSLDGAGKVLILEGQSMAGTETAADFVFDDGYLLPFLETIRSPDGSVPYFELLLRSKSISGESSRLEVVAKRIEGN